jgi:hypothetical protein
LRFNDEAACTRVAAQLEAFRVSYSGHASQDDRRVFHFSRRGTALLVQSNCTDAVPQQAVLWNTMTDVQARFSDVFYHMDALKSGQHHPDGVLWIRRAGIPPCNHAERVSLRAVAPTVLRLLGLDPPDHMDCPPLQAVLDESQENGPRTLSSSLRLHA